MRLVRERARVDGGVRRATARARPRACASAVRGQRARRGERWRSLARATRARAARRSGERPGARRVLAASGRLTSFLRRDSPKIYRRIEHTVSVRLIGRDGRNFALRPAVICRAAKRLIPMIGESSSSSMKHRKDSLDRRPGGWSPAAGGLSRSGGSGGPGWAARVRTGIRRSRGRRSMLALCGRSAERPGCSASEPWSDSLTANPDSA